MPKKPKPETHPDESREAFDAWADQVATLEPATIRSIIALAGRLAADRRLSADDRRFATSQVDAVRRALRRAKSKASKTAKASKPTPKAKRNH